MYQSLEKLKIIKINFFFVIHNKNVKFLVRNCTPTLFLFLAGQLLSRHLNPERHSSRKCAKVFCVKAYLCKYINHVLLDEEEQRRLRDTGQHV